MQITLKCSSLCYLFQSTKSNINYFNMTLLYDIPNKKWKREVFCLNSQTEKTKQRKTIESTASQLASTCESLKSFSG